MQADNKSALVSFRVGPVYCCASSQAVVAIISPPSLNQMPGSASGNRGVFRHGGYTVSALDLRFRFGIEASDDTKGRIIITDLKGKHYGFWVDDIIDVTEFPSQGWGNLPAQIPREIFSRTLLRDKHILLFSDFEKLAALRGGGHLRQYLEHLAATAGKDASSPAPVPADAPASIVIKSIPLAANEGIPTTPATPPSSPKPITTETPLHPHTVDTTKVRPKSATLREPPKAATPARGVSSLPSSSSRVDSIRNTTTTPHKTAPHTSMPTASAPMGERLTSPCVTPVNTATASRPVTPAKFTDHHSQESSITAPTDNATLTPTGQGSAGIWVVLIFILCLLGGGAGYFYFTLQAPDALDNANTTVPSPTPSLPLASVAPTSSSPVVPPADPAASYSAKIDHQSGDITITVSTPDNTPALKEETTESAQKPVPGGAPPIENTLAAVPPSETSMPQAPITQTPLQTTPPKPKREPHEVIHVVVKGDTLWRIAERYVKDPFRYPELARLSHIKDPDRIYPGDRVHIIQVQKPLH